MFLKAQIISNHSTIYLLAHPSPSFHNQSLFLMLHRWKHAPEPLLCILLLPALSHPLSPLQPLISLSQPQSSAAPPSYATSPTPSTIASKMTSSAVDPLHLSDHKSEPECKIDSFPVPVTDPDSDYEPAVDLQSSSPSLTIDSQPLRGQPRGQARGQLARSKYMTLHASCIGPCMYCIQLCKATT